MKGVVKMLNNAMLTEYVNPDKFNFINKEFPVKSLILNKEKNMYYSLIEYYRINEYGDLIGIQ